MLDGTGRACSESAHVELPLSLQHRVVFSDVNNPLVDLSVPYWLAFKVLIDFYYFN